MKTTKDVENFFNVTFSDCKSTLKECSKNDKDISMVNNNKSAFNFDKISKKLFPRCLTSIDSIYFRDNHIYFIEFKSGFVDKINKNYISSKYSCENCNTLEKKHFDLLCTLRAKVKKELTTNVQLKIIESLYVFKDVILPNCADTTNEFDVNFTLVFESGEIDPLDELEIGMESLANIETKNKLSESLRKYQCQDINRNKLFFEKINVMSNLEFNNSFIYN